MNKIEEKNVEKERKHLEDFLLNSRIMDSKETEYLKNRRYELYDLGTGKTVYTTSKTVKIMTPHKSLDLPESILTIGISNISRGRYSVYRAYCKEIV